MEERRDYTGVLAVLVVVVLIIHRRRGAASRVDGPPDEALPTYIKWKLSLLMPVRDQGPCAACWAMSVADMMADQLNVRTNGAYGIRPLSAQYILNCTPSSGCGVGGSPEEVYNLPQLTVQGVPLEADVPYTGTVQKCAPVPPGAFRVRTVRGTALNLCDDPANALPSMRASIIRANVQRMRRALLHSPIVGTLRVTKDLYEYRANGVYRGGSPISPLVGYHAVEIIGFCHESVKWAEEGFDPGYWICRSSWGLGWGVPDGVKSGFCYIEAGKNCADIESRASICLAEMPSDLVPVAARTPQHAGAYVSYSDRAVDPDREVFVGSVCRALGGARGCHRRLV